MDQTKLTIIMVILGIVFITGSQSIFTVDETEQALVLQLGNPVGKPRGPGLHFKLPLVQEVRIFDSRILSVDPPSEQVVISSSTSIKKLKALDPTTPKTTEETIAVGDQTLAVVDDAGTDLSSISGEPIIVDSFARYKITDPLQFLKTLGTVARANSRIENILNDATRAALGKTTLEDLLSTKRADVMNTIKTRVNKKIQEDKLGIEIVDVRIVRADLTAELRTSTVRRMISELQERATETRAKGEERAKEIRSTADKERTIILAQAERDAQMIRGEGDNKAISIYSAAYNKDKEFYGFMRSMEAYRSTLANPQTQLILNPDSEFFRYFENGR